MSVRKFQNGDTVILNEKCPKFVITQFGFNPGDCGIIQSYGYDAQYNVEFKDVKGNTRVVYIPSNALSKGKSVSKKEILLSQITKAEEKIEATKAFIHETRVKIQFMEEMGVEEFDENEFKAYQTLLIIEKSEMSTLEKAKAIAKLISNK
jgi:hypothetical protein